MEGMDRETKIIMMLECSAVQSTRWTGELGCWRTLTRGRRKQTCRAPCH